MPSKSKKQHNFMEAIAHSKEFAKKAGVPQSVGKDFAEADKGKKFRKGGSVNPTEQGINKQKTHHGTMALPNVSLNKYSTNRFGTGGDVNYTYGGKGQINKQRTKGGSIDGYQKNVPNVSLNKYIGKKEGGMATESKKESRAEMKADKAQDKAMIKKAFSMHDKQEHKGEHTNLSKLKKGGMAMKKMAMGGMSRMASKGEHSVQKQSKRGAEMVKMAKGGLASGHKSADGCAVRGKTRAMAPSMCGGGMAKGKK